MSQNLGNKCDYIRESTILKVHISMKMLCIFFLLLHFLAKTFDWYYQNGVWTTKFSDQHLQLESTVKIQMAPTVTWFHL